MRNSESTTTTKVFSKLKILECRNIFEKLRYHRFHKNTKDNETKNNNNKINQRLWLYTVTAVDHITYLQVTITNYDMNWKKIHKLNNNKIQFKLTRR